LGVLLTATGLHQDTLLLARPSRYMPPHLSPLPQLQPPLLPPRLRIRSPRWRWALGPLLQVDRNHLSLYLLCPHLAVPPLLLPRLPRRRKHLQIRLIFSECPAGLTKCNNES
jgi:hypothetical protein